jgi:cytochrome c553
MNYTLTVLLACIGFSWLPSAALARGDVVAGQAKAKQVCAACHGENGDKPLQPDYPVISGQHVDYLAKSLRDYKSGVRKNAIMSGQAQALSAKDIEDVSAWFASRSGPLHVKR